MARTPIVRLARLFQTRSRVPRKNNPIPADIIIFVIIYSRVIFFFILIMVCCVYLLESRLDEAIPMRTC